MNLRTLFCGLNLSSIKRPLLLILSLSLFFSCSSLGPKKTVKTGPEKPITTNKEIDSLNNKEAVLVQEVEAPEDEPIVSETAEPSEQKEVRHQEQRERTSDEAPFPPREFRAAWVATVANINWPSKPGLPSKVQQQEAIALLDFLKEHHFNAVILQVRPQADALYESQLEPWSYFLTGKQGTAPEPFYDPLHFWIEAAHDRGLELHAWLNPYRAHHTTGGEISEESVVKKNPELVVKLKDGQYWMVPSEEETRKHSTKVVMDLVRRYDVDGIHFDDYFYPYDSYNGGMDFPDDVSWNKYRSQGGKLSRGDWRRESVNMFIKNLYEEIKAEKPYVKFGLSPFGIWRPGFPKSIQGYDQYDKLYADAKLWLNKGWIDYFTPQLYWSINKIPQSFPVLLGWWESENTEDRHLWPGISVGLGGGEQNIDETINQIMITRGMLPKDPGAVHWSIGPLVKHKELAKAILEGPYQKEALVPRSPWLDDQPPAAPVVVSTESAGQMEVTWVPGDEEEILTWVIYKQYGNTWSHDIVPGHVTKRMLPNVHTVTGDKLSAVVVTAIDRSGNESEFIPLNF